ncbi:hypothetical protein AVEN_190871-1 [Araneus ventricosus]|uniref:Uncharacterized protein n=1 Tax=Araneus ventricosus TaxID=182803 RepID=A0A4Y2CQD2_ARAVE|nr:hypothetical protein AVEN_190871-1 [Araneus ventricosus]
MPLRSISNRMAHSRPGNILQKQQADCRTHQDSLHHLNVTRTGWKNHRNPNLQTHDHLALSRKANMAFTKKNLPVRGRVDQITPKSFSL